MMLFENLTTLLEFRVFHDVHRKMGLQLVRYF
jgi:hypothetical protein